MDEEWLREEYCVKKRKAQDIGNEIECGPECIWDRARDYGLKRKKIVKLPSRETKKKLSKINTGKKLSKETKRKISIATRKEKNPYWKGGYIVRYDSFAHQVIPIEDVRRCPSNKVLMEVVCTYCGKWFVPDADSMFKRLSVIKGKRNGDSRLYCSDGCKKSCSIYRVNNKPRINKRATSREVQPELRQIVFKRDGWVCQKCGRKDYLHCHHITGIKQNPIESADVDNCITLCKKCHKWVHTLSGCNYYQLRCKEEKANASS